MKKFIVILVAVVITGVYVFSIVHVNGYFNAEASDMSFNDTETVAEAYEEDMQWSDTEADAETYEEDMQWNETESDAEVSEDDTQWSDTESEAEVYEDDTQWSDTEAVDEKIIDVPAICQYPELPTGCESVSATMVLQYYGSAVTETEFAGDWLECSNDFYSSSGRDFGPDPHKVFAGDPFSEYSYGCYAGPIVDAINNNSSMCTAEEITGKTLEQLCEEYIDNDKPLLIWATMYMKESFKSNSWYIDDGSEFTWTAQEHCMVLVGYDEDNYYINDPLTGTTMAYEKELVEQRFAELGSQAVYIRSVEK